MTDELRESAKVEQWHRDEAQELSGRCDSSVCGSNAENWRCIPCVRADAIATALAAAEQRGRVEGARAGIEAAASITLHEGAERAIRALDAEAIVAERWKP